MTSLPKHLDTKQPQRIDWGQWVNATQAAELMSVNRTVFLRRCKDQLMGQGLAIMARPPQGGRVQWFVSRRLDTRLAAESGITSKPFASEHLASLPESKRDQARQRAACVNELRAWRTRETRPRHQWMNQLLAQLNERFPDVAPKERTLRRWDQLYKTTGDLLKLVDTRGGDQRSGVSPEAWAEFERIWLSERRPSIAHVHRQVAAYAKGCVPPLHWCTLPTLRRMVIDRIPPEKQALHRDPALYRQKYEPKIMQDLERYKAGRCWVGDHSTLDLWCRWQGKVIRPTITLWQDWRTRKWAGYVLSHSPSTDTILAAFRVAMMDPANMGGPTEVMVDNGRDYDSYTMQGMTKHQRMSQVHTKGKVITDVPAFNGIFGMLNIGVSHSIPYGPNGKSRIERSFGVMHKDHDVSFTTYCGGESADKPEYLNDLLRNKPQLIPSFEHVAARLADWVKGFNARAEHDIDDLAVHGRKVSPDDAMTAWCTSPLLRDTGDALDMMLMRWERPVSVGVRGVTIAPSGTPLSYGQFEPALSAFKGKGQKVHVAWDPRDMRSVSIYDKDMRFICHASQNELGGQSGELGHQQVRELTRKKRQYTKALKNVEANRHMEYLTPGEILASGLDKPTTPAPSGGSYRLPQAEDAAGTAPTRSKQRKAAGAEHDESPTHKTKPQDRPSIGSMASLASLGNQHQPDALDDEPVNFNLLIPTPDEPQESDASPAGLGGWGAFTRNAQEPSDD